MTFVNYILLEFGHELLQSTGKWYSVVAVGGIDKTFRATRPYFCEDVDLEDVVDFVVNYKVRHGYQIFF